ncbi:MAG: Yqey-like protein-domain-containing protein [Linnemannia gamsii]|nr:MAG: Yqey-like protein-domain-containing protein [Linnemannia gamsii]
MFARSALTRPLAAASRACLFYTTEAAPAAPQLLLRIKADVKDAMRSRDKERLAVVKGILSDLTYLEKSPQAPTTVTDSTLQVLIQKSIKRRQESVLSFQAAGRAEQAAQENKEIEMLKVYLPQEMTEQEIEAEVRKVVESTGAMGSKDMGKVMKELGGLDPARAPKKVVSDTVKRVLASL